MDRREQYLKLRTGSDVRGIAVEADGKEITLTPETAACISAAFAEWLILRTGKKPEELRIGTGHDSRVTAEAMTRGVLRGLSGTQAFSCGLVSTPSMFMSTVLPGSAFDGAVMVTASHLPFYYSGLKFFTKDGGLEGTDVDEILEMAAEMPASADEGAEEEPAAKAFPLRELYCSHIRELIINEVQAEVKEQPLAGLHIVVDAGNGSSGFFATDILAPLGADISGSVYLEPDGMFPNHVPNPERKDAMEAVRRAVLDAGADLGVIFDCDGDRAAVVFADGTEVNRNHLIALMAAILKDRYPGSTIVTDSVTSDELTVFLEEKLGLRHLRFKRGYRNVIRKAVELCAEGIESPLAIETSGHGALKENYFSDDGAYMSVKVICRMAALRKEGRRIEELIADLGSPAEACEIRYKILVPDFRAAGEKAMKDLREMADRDPRMTVVSPNFEGIRIAFDDEEVKGWILLRLSLHEPVMPMNIEAQNEGGTGIILRRLEPFFADHPELGR